METHEQDSSTFTKALDSLFEVSLKKSNSLDDLTPLLRP